MENRLVVDNDYIRAMRYSTLWYAANAWPEKYYLPFSPIHFEMDREIHQNAAPIILILIFRGAAKTQFARANAAKDLHWGDSTYTVWVGPNRPQANKSVRFIVDMMTRPNLRRIFGDPKALSTKWSIDEYFHFKNKISFGKWQHEYDGYLEPLGVEQQLQGSNIGGSRITRAILDDIEPPNERWSVDMVSDKLDWFDKTLFFSLQDLRTSKIIVLSTNSLPEGFSGQLSRRKNVYTVRYPVMAYTQDIADQFGVKLNESLWPERYPTDMLKDMMLSMPGFQNQMLMMDERSETNKIPMDKLDIFDDLDKCPAMSSDLKLCFTVDMAHKKGSKNDRSSIVAALWDQGRDEWCLEAKQDRWGVIGTMEKLFEMIKVWTLVFPGVEVRVGVEEDTWDVIERFFKEHRQAYEEEYPLVRMSLVELKHKLVAKVDRVKAKIPVVEAGRCHIYGPKCEILISRLLNFDGRKQRVGDDVEDAWAYQRDLGMRSGVSSRKDDDLPTEGVPWWQKNGWKLQENVASRRYGGLYFPRRI